MVSPRKTGALVGAFIGTREAMRRRIDPDHVWNSLLLALILGVIGARLYHVISSPAGTNKNAPTATTARPSKIPF